MTKIKICGLKRFEDIEYVNEAKPDYAGFVIEISKSYRSVSYQKAAKLAEKLDKNIMPVGVFADAPLQLPARLMNAGIISVAQLNGHEDERYIRSLRSMTDGKIIKAFSVTGRQDIEKAISSIADYILLDQGSGGSGRTFDWSLAESAGRKFFLAGGLDLYNLKEAISRLEPYAVDLSSSLETEGIKDRKKIIKTVEAVREYDRRK